MIWQALRDWWRQWRCPEHVWAWERNVYGDEINWLNCRSIWVCEKCAKWERRQCLHIPPREVADA